jgi:hypothetical protein
MASPYSEPLFDLLSYARRGPGRRDRVTSTDVSQIARTAGRTPEVMVKVLSRSANDLNSVRKHLEYIGRKGKVDLEGDGGEKQHTPKDLLDDWDLELDEYRVGSNLAATDRKQAPRLVHKVLFSMPAGTPPRKVLTAVQNFCREELGLKHRYVMALHTDEPHPHVHVVIKAMSEQGQRLNIRKATLRRWRADFAWHLRAVGVKANATQRYIRGETAPRKPDGIYRAGLRSASTYLRSQAEAAADELATGKPRVDPGKRVLVETREKVEQSWQIVASRLENLGEHELAHEVRRFVQQMPPVKTEREWIMHHIRPHLRTSHEPRRER